MALMCKTARTHIGLSHWYKARN